MKILHDFIAKLRRGTATDDDFVDADKRAFLFGFTATVAGIVVAPTVILPAANPHMRRITSVGLSTMSERWADLYLDERTVVGPPQTLMHADDLAALLKELYPQETIEAALYADNPLHEMMREPRDLGLIPLVYGKPIGVK